MIPENRHERYDSKIRVIRIKRIRMWGKIMKNKSFLGNSILLFTAFIWGTAFVAQRVGMESIEPITFNAARMAIAAVFIGALALILSKKNGSSGKNAEERKSYRKNTIIGGIVCGCFLTFGSVLQQIGLVSTTAGKAGFITAMYMLLVPIISFVLFKKKNTLLVWSAVVLGIVGMYLLCISGDFSLSKGDAYIAVCAVFFAGHILSCDHFVGRSNPIALSAIQFITATVISAVVALIAEEPTIAKLTSAIVPILYCGLISGGLGYTLQMVGPSYTEPTIASLLMSMESVFAVLAGTVLLKEKMSMREVIGCIIMFVAIVLVQLPGKRYNTVGNEKTI